MPTDLTTQPNLPAATIKARISKLEDIGEIDLDDGRVAGDEDDAVRQARQR